MALACIKKVVAGLADDCLNPAVGGAENVITLINLDDWQNATITRSATNQMLIEGIVLATGKYGYSFEFASDTINAVATRAGIRTYDHSISGKINVSSNAVKKQLDDMDGGRYVAIVKMRNPVPELKYQIFGEEAGLVISEWKKEANADNGIVSFSLASSDVSKEPKESKSLFNTDLTTTSAIITSLITVVP